MKYKYIVLLLIVIGLCVGSAAFAQDTLPKFTAKTYGDQKFLLSWTNNYKDVTQISIQRSFDSLKNFRTILTVTDPTLAQNGFADLKSPFPKPFYRILIVFTEGRYTYTKSKRAFWDTARVVTPTLKVDKVAPTLIPDPQKNTQTTPPQQMVPPVSNVRLVIEEPPVQVVDEGKVRTVKIPSAENRATNVTSIDTRKPFSDPALIAPPPPPKKIFLIKRNDSLLMKVHEMEFPEFRDSILHKTRDTLVFRRNDTILIKSFVPKDLYIISKYVFVNKDGNIEISVPPVNGKTYALHFFEENGQSLFQLKKILEPRWVVDKSFFLRSGWYRFELFEDGKLKEKNKLFLPKEF